LGGREAASSLAPRQEAVMRLTARVKCLLVLLCVMCPIVLFSSCAATGKGVEEKVQANDTGAAAPHAEKQASAIGASAAHKTALPKPAVSSSASVQAPGDVYATIPKPLTAVQCGQCHESIYMKLRINGGKHKFQCRNCHKKFHSYNPIRHNWNEIMPKCSSCHKQPHGPKLTQCLKCHQEPHTPMVIPYGKYVTSRCGMCHKGPASELKKYPSAHTRLGCAKCHETHGEIPTCFKCHKPHLPNQDLASCKSCHPVHEPLQIKYGKGNAATCATCHSKVYNEWKHTKSKHGKVDCAQCHPRHGYVPKCSKCHGKPHDPGMLRHFKKCLDCHINVHDLPTT